MGKIFFAPWGLNEDTAYIYKHILNHYVKYNILSNSEHGFRALCSCETQLLITLHDFFTNFDGKTHQDIAILDFSKAFDTVPHKHLLQKLNPYGVNGKVNNWVKCFLTNHSQCVIIEGVASSPVHVDSGVPQGIVPGPLFFLTQINNLPAEVSSTVRLFADDCLLYRTIKTQSDQHKLQDDLISLQGYARQSVIFSVSLDLSLYYSITNSITKCSNKLVKSQKPIPRPPNQR